MCEIDEDNERDSENDGDALVDCERGESEREELKVKDFVGESLVDAVGAGVIVGVLVGDEVADFEEAVALYVALSVGVEVGAGVVVAEKVLDCDADRE